MGGSPDHAGYSEQLVGAPAGGVSGRDRRGCGWHHRGAQSSERRSHALGGRSGGDAPAGGCRAPARRAGVRSRGNWGRGRAVREFRGSRAVVTSPAPILAPELAKAVAAQRDRLDLEVLSRAYRISAQAHQGQKRLSGDDFVSHSVAVATILVEQQMDTTTIAAALLHDVVEDSDITLDVLRRDFGNEVADLVDGLTKISTLNFRSTAEEQAENYRKLLMSVARDARVIIIKLADRLHNMRTLDPLPPEKRKRIALETRELYAPLAHRFGMAGVKAELEDLAFKYHESQVEQRPVAPHHRLWSERAAVRNPDPHARHASHGGIWYRRALALQGKREDRRRARSSPVVVPAADRAATRRA